MLNKKTIDNNLVINAIYGKISILLWKLETSQASMWKENRAKRKGPIEIKRMHIVFAFEDVSLLTHKQFRKRLFYLFYCKKCNPNNGQ